MKALDTFKNSVPFLKKEPKISRKEALAVIPIRNAAVEWSKSEDEVTLSIPLRRDKLVGFMEKLFSRKRFPDKKQIVLDEVGSTVWELCDGEHDISSIVKELSSKYKMNRREAEASVTAFFKNLTQRKLIGLVQGGKKKG